MDQAAQGQPSRWRFVRIILAVLILATAAWFWFSPRPELQVLTPLPPEFTLIPIERINKKPTIDLHLPLFGDVTYPPSATVPDIDAKTAGGILIFEKETLGPVWLSYRWEIEGETLSYTASSLKPIICPRIYGFKPVIGKLSVDGYEPIEVRLPATGTASPKASVQTLTTENGKIVCEPRALISPAFPIRYRIRYDLQNKNQSFISFRSTNPLDGFSLGFIPIPDWTAKREIWADPGKDFSYDFVESTLSQKRVKVRVKRLPDLKPPRHQTIHAEPSPNLFLTALDGSFEARAQIFERDGKSVVEWSNVYEPVMGTKSWHSGFGTVLYKGDWFGLAASSRAAPGYFSEPQLGFEVSDLKDGSTVEVYYYSTATGYTSSTSKVGKGFNKLSSP